MHAPVPPSESPKLSFGEKLGYGLGDTASCFIWGTMTSFLLFFYTDIFGITAAAAGTLFLFARSADGFVDLIVGAVADRTKTRWGKFRPYLLWFAIPMAAIFVATFTTPNLGMDGKIIYAWVTYNLLMIIYTAINIPYGALSGVMTDDPLDRTSLNSFRMLGSQSSTLVVNAFTLPLIAYFGHGNKAVGYQWTVLLFAVIATACFFITFLTTRERILPPREQKPDLRRDLRLLFSNRPWVLMFIAGGGTIFSIIKGSATLYYCTYYLRIDQSQIHIPWLFRMDEISFFLALGSVGFIAGALTVRPWVRLFGKKNLFIGLMVIGGLMSAAFFYIPPSQINLILLLQLIGGYASGVSAPIYFAMIADTADYAEWKFHIRTTGMIFSANSFAGKIGIGIGGALSGYLLKHYNYVPGAVQSAGANHGILLMNSLIPAIGYMLVAAIFMLYPLNEAFCHRMREDLGKRRQL